MALFTAQLDPQLSQGDLFRPDWDSDRAPALGSVVIISENCDVENSPDTILVADAVADAQTEAGLLAHIRGGKVWRAFHLAQFGRWINLRSTRPVQKQLFDGRLDARLASMTPEGQNALAGKMFSSLTHRLPPTQRYFRDAQGVVWDAWEVRRKDIDQHDGTSPTRVAAALVTGWVAMATPTETRRLAPCPFGWQYLPETGLQMLLQQAAVADQQDQAAQAIDQTVRANA